MYLKLFPAYPGALLQEITVSTFSIQLDYNPRSDRKKRYFDPVGDYNCIRPSWIHEGLTVISWNWAPGEARNAAAWIDVGESRKPFWGEEDQFPASFGQKLMRTYWKILFQRIANPTALEWALCPVQTTKTLSDICKVTGRAFQGGTITHTSWKSRRAFCFLNKTKFGYIDSTISSNTILSKTKNGTKPRFNHVRSPNSPTQPNTRTTQLCPLCLYVPLGRVFQLSDNISDQVYALA